MVWWLREKMAIFIFLIWFLCPYSCWRCSCCCWRLCWLCSCCCWHWCWLCSCCCWRWRWPCLFRLRRRLRIRERSNLCIASPPAQLTQHGVLCPPIADTLPVHSRFLCMGLCGPHLRASEDLDGRRHLHRRCSRRRARRSLVSGPSKLQHQPDNRRQLWRPMAIPSSPPPFQKSKNT